MNGISRLLHYNWYARITVELHAGQQECLDLRITLIEVNLSWEVRIYPEMPSACSSYAATTVRRISRRAVVIVTAIHTPGNRLSWLDFRYARHSRRHNTIGKSSILRSLSKRRSLTIFPTMLHKVSIYDDATGSRGEIGVCSKTRNATLLSKSF